LLRRQAVSRDQFHLVAKTIQLVERGVDVWGDAKALELFVDDGRDKDVVFAEEILADGFGI
jgi:hypothetical protein